MVKRHGIKVTADRKEYPDKCFSALEEAVNSRKITRTGYDAVLVDEGHDFDSRWLALIARLFDNASRSLLLMYDDAQSIYRRERALNFSLASVGIQAQGRTSILPVNYRNPKRILHFAYDSRASILKNIRTVKYRSFSHRRAVKRVRSRKSCVVLLNVMKPDKLQTGWRSAMPCVVTGVIWLFCVRQSFQ